MNTVVIKGERCSGTNYLQKLIETNFTEVKCQHLLGWKHSYLNTFENSLHDSDEFLTIILFRNIYDWLKSLYSEPHHLYLDSSLKETKNLSFSEFIRTKFYQSNNSRELICERHPFTLEHPKDLFEIRKWKNQNFLNHQKVLKNVLYLKYEDLESNPEKVIDDINNRWLQKDYQFKNWIYYKDTDKIYTKKKYLQILLEDVNYINESVDWTLENEIGYHMII